MVVDVESSSHRPPLVVRRMAMYLRSLVGRSPQIDWSTETHGSGWVVSLVNFHRKTTGLESLINKVATLLKKALTQVFFCEYLKIFTGTYFEEHLRTVASVLLNSLFWYTSPWPLMKRKNALSSNKCSKQSQAWSLAHINDIDVSCLERQSSCKTKKGINMFVRVWG